MSSGKLGSSLAPEPFELIALMVLTCILGFSADLFRSDELGMLAVLGPVAYATILTGAAVKLLRQRRAAVMTPIFAFYVSAAVYMGIGSIAPLIVNSVSQDYLFNIGKFGLTEILKLDLVVAVCTVFVLGTVAAVEKMYGPVPISRPGNALFTKSRSLILLGFFFYFVGSVTNLLTIVPEQLGYSQGFTAGAVSQLTNNIYVGIFILAYWAIEYRPRYIWIPVLLAIFESTLGLIMLSKSALLLPMVGLLLAFVVKSRGLTLPVFAAVFLPLLFLLSAPLVSFGRDAQFRDYHANNGATLSKRAHYIVSYFDKADVEYKGDEIQYGWVRISYVNWGIKGIELFDKGLPGNSVDGVWVVLVPRLLWPNKPEVGKLGGDLYLAVTHAAEVSGAEVSVSMGLFAESYWDFGWYGAPLLMIPFGMLIAIISRFSVVIVESRDLFFMPAVFYGVRIGSRVDGLFVLDVAGAAVIVICLILALRMCALFLRGVGEPRRPAIL